MLCLCLRLFGQDDAVQLRQSAERHDTLRSVVFARVCTEMSCVTAEMVVLRPVVELFAATHIVDMPTESIVRAQLPLDALSQTPKTSAYTAPHFHHLHALAESSERKQSCHAQEEHDRERDPKLSHRILHTGQINIKVAGHKADR